MRNKIVVVSGFRGSGKSTVAAGILRSQPGIILRDPNEDDAYTFMPNTVYSLEDVKKYLNDMLIAQRAGGAETMAIRYVPDLPEDDHADLNEFCAIVWNRLKNVWVGFEEISEAVQNPSAAAMPAQLRRIVNRGRHRGLNQIYCGLRYAEIPRPVTAGADVQVIFQTQEPGDLDSLHARIGDEATEKVQHLGEHEALVFLRNRTFETVSSRDAKEIARLLSSRPEPLTEEGIVERAAARGR
ncbi:MAG TPA: hypothetical protein VHF01_17870 [Candidatus Acidoferrum sp.]|nr:hypothetical protein [Candidatus Acidoferrum sp.]